MATFEHGYLYEELAKMEKKVNEYYGASAITQNSNYSEEIDQQISKCLSQVNSYKARLDTLHNKVLEVILSNGDDSTTEDVRRHKGSSTKVIERIRSKLNEYRKGFSKLPAPTTSGTGTIASCIEEGSSSEQLQISPLQNFGTSSQVAFRSNQRGSSAVGVPERSLSNTEEILLNCLISLKDEYAIREVQRLAATMTRFSGDYIDFPFFITEFRGLVHERSEFTNLQKHFLLRNLVDGDAARVIRDVPLSETSYQKALSGLINHYGNCEMIVHCIFNDMLASPKIVKESNREALRDLLMRVDRSISTFDLIKCDKDYFCTSMYPLLLRTIPEKMSIRFLCEQKKHEPRVGLNKSEFVSLRMEAIGVPKLSSARFKKLRDFIEEAVLVREQYPQLFPKGTCHPARLRSELKSKQN